MMRKFTFKHKINKHIPTQIIISYTYHTAIDALRRVGMGDTGTGIILHPDYYYIFDYNEWECLNCYGEEIK